MSGSSEADILISQCLKKLENFRPKMTGQNGQICSHLCPVTGRKSLRITISEGTNTLDYIEYCGIIDLYKLRAVS